MAPRATARLARPEGARTFEVVVYVSAAYIERLGQGRFAALLNQTEIGTAVLDKAVPVTLRFPAPPGPAGTVEVEFRVDPPLVDPNGGPSLGQPIAAFGFRP